MKTSLKCEQGHGSWNTECFSACGLQIKWFLFQPGGNSSSHCGFFLHGHCQLEGQRCQKSQRSLIWRGDMSWVCALRRRDTSGFIFKCWHFERKKTWTDAPPPTPREFPNYKFRAHFLPLFLIYQESEVPKKEMKPTRVSLGKARQLIAEWSKYKHPSLSV